MKWNITRREGKYGISRECRRDIRKKSRRKNYWRKREKGKTLKNSRKR